MLGVVNFTGYCLKRRTWLWLFLFLLKFAFQGYLQLLCKLLKENLEKMPGDSRTQIGFITFDSTVHFYSLKVGNKSWMIKYQFMHPRSNRAINMQGCCIRNILGSPLGSQLSTWEPKPRFFEPRKSHCCIDRVKYKEGFSPEWLKTIIKVVIPTYRNRGK